MLVRTSGVAYSRFGRAASIAATHLLFRWRRLRRPEASFSDFYVEAIGRTIDSGGVHRTLGKNNWLKGAVDAEERERALGAFRRNGLHRFETLVNHGLAPHHSCVDYGCGMLRIGQHIIRFLNCANYWGLDVTDRFFRDGVELLEEGLIESKAPHLRVIDDSVIAALERKPPDFVFSNAVLKHVPPFELDGFFDNFVRLIGPRTRAIIFFEEAPEQRQTAGATWAYPADLLVAKIRGRNSSATIGVERCAWVQGRRGPNRMQSILRIGGKDCEASPGFALSFGSIGYADHHVVRNAALQIPPAVLPTGLLQDTVDASSAAMSAGTPDPSAGDAERQQPEPLPAVATAIAANSNEKEAVRSVEHGRRWHSRLGSIAAAVALLIYGGAVATLAIRHRTSDAEISGLASAAVDLNHAIAAAAQLDQGRIVQADFKIRDGVPGYVVEIQSATSINRVIVDPNTAQVLKIKVRGVRPRLSGDQAENTSESLALAVSLAEEITKGKAISADFGRPDIYDIDVAVDGRREQVTIDSASRAVQSIAPDDDI